MVEQLYYERIEFPVAAKQYNKIEKQNNININVFGYENSPLYPINESKESNQDMLNLLLITEKENRHYVLITDFNKLMYNQTKHKCKKHFCMYCLQYFSSEDVLTNHKTNCMVINSEQAIKMPDKDNNILKFQNFHKQMPVSFAIYADFEAITEKIQGCSPNNAESYTELYQNHTDCSYGYKVVCCYDDKYPKPVKIYRGEKAVYKFMEEMLKEVEKCKKIATKRFNIPLAMTDEDERDFKEANKCHICDKEYAKTDTRVRDHCHITSNCRSSAHQDCNLKLRINAKELKIPVIFQISEAMIAALSCKRLVLLPNKTRNGNQLCPK